MSRLIRGDDAACDTAIIESAPSPIGVYEATSPYNLKIANRMYSSLSGFSSDGGSIAGLLGRLSDNDARAVRRALDQVAAGGKSVLLSDVCLENPGQGLTVWDWSFYPVVDSEGSLTGIGHLAVDVTEHRRVETGLIESGHRWQLLSAIASQLLVTDDPQGLVQSLCERVMQVLDCQVFFNYLLEPSGDSLRLNACAGIPREAALSIDRLDLGAAVCGCVARDGEGIICENIPLNPDPRTDLVAGFGVRAYACNPLRSEGARIVGTLSFGTTTRDSFSEADLDLMRTVADQVAVAMDRIRLLNAERSSRSQLDAALESLTDAVAVCDAEGRLVMFNTAFATFSGFKSRNECPDRVDDYSALVELFLPDGTKGQPEEWPLSRALRGESGANVEFAQRRVDTGHSWIAHFSYAPIRDIGGSIAGAVLVARDTTEQRRAQEALRESEARYRELVQNANSAIIRWRRDGTITFFNEYAQRLFGYSERDIIGRDVRVLIPQTESTGHSLGGLFDALIEHPEKHATNVNENVRRDGSRLWMAWTNRPIFDEQGKLKEILAVGSDVSEERRVQEDLRQAQERISVVITQLPAVLWTTDTDLRFTFAAGAALETVGVRVEDFMGRSMHELLPERNEALTACRSALAGQMVRYDDHYNGVYFRSHVLPLRDAAGTIVGTVGVSLDISDSKRVEEELRRRAEEMETVMEVAPVAIWVAHDPECRTITGNSRANTFYDANPGENVSATTTDIRRFFSGGRELSAEDLPMQQAAALNSEIRDAEFEVEMPGGKRRVLWGYASPLRQADGQVRGAVGAFVDVTEHRELEHHKREFYRRTILGATSGKLVICEHEEIAELTGPCETAASWAISSVKSLGRMRDELVKLLAGIGVPRERSLDLLSCAVEAATNALKHAGKGEARLCRRNGRLMFSVTDSGPGIGAMQLPDVALLVGYSTAGTLGMGYKVMLHFADRVYLATGPEGTTVAVELSLNPSSKIDAGNSAVCGP